MLKRFPSTHHDVRRIYGLMADRYAREGRAAEAKKYKDLAKPR